MPLPVIIVDSATGSDTAASGAGPGDGTTAGSALTGTAAATDGAGTTVTLDSGTVLTSVATDGSHAIYLVDATAGARNFGKITATSGSGGATPTVTVSNAFGLTLSGKSWAIGGKRASVGGTNSAKLFNNNSASGDAMPGWVVEMQSGHSETLSASLTLRRDGDTTSGPVTLRGKSGAATLPLLTFSNNGKGIDVTTASLKNVVLRDFELQNTNGTKTSATAVDIGVSNYTNSVQVIGLKIAHATNYFNRGIIPGEVSVLRGNEVGYCLSNGIDVNASAFNECQGAEFLFNNVHHCGGHGIYINTAGNGRNLSLRGNRCWNNTGSGIRADGLQGVLVESNTCNNNTASGLLVQSIGTSSASSILNNNFTNNGAYGVNFNGQAVGALGMISVAYNNTYNNTSGAYSTAGVATNDPAVDPQYASASTGDFTPSNTATRAATPSGWIGAVQPASAGGGTTTYVINQIINRYYQGEEVD